MSDPEVRSDEWSAKMWPLAERLLDNAINRLKNPNVVFEIAFNQYAVKESKEAPKWPWWIDNKDQEPYRFLMHIWWGGPAPDDWSDDDKALAKELLETIDRVTDIMMEREEAEWDREMEEKKKKGICDKEVKEWEECKRWRAANDAKTTTEAL